MRWSIAIPQSDADGFDAPGVKAHLARAEELGFEGAWTMELTIGAAPVLAPLEVLAYAAACTERLRLGVGVLITPLHDPLQLAASLTTVDRLSHGRLDVGIAPGGGSREFAAFGIEREGFVARFTEGLALMKEAWSDAPRVSFDGRFRRVEDLAIAPKPVQRPHPPVWFGGSAPKALARAVRLGDAFLGAGSVTTATFADQVVTLRRELERRERGTFPIAKRVYVRVDDDPARARRGMVASLHGIYGDTAGIEDVPVTGTADDVARGLAEVRDAGAGMIVLDPLGDDVTADREQLERLAADVLPLVS
ncbi:alkanesulfonate monooxygenase SsuD/methylene tetrahydromethanopterin reductase-like flavin-dependent oxidoreductase (luciferase family) [Actinomycetospora succinea]|uniref:Alkanesulfonate monooxygenase SsuD/methylene tetrahydromethanopterin reductase-like flavin-dependent oxidoreductase (Luciferase family) n=1 Tax=Actinomycetospora succinea TaxID=663603 RepID=A0A4R6UPA1_9PSEU|nr:LLM class flavin-dependent oxidoreductase [Actinomycetospora succinea]TDQ47055.1 alkanesulfonate monooxygenase SsuD/methylene tetrahydromethanopterin reductase-like flavin-dependent oxidoreductase (luciferase family) [Actinomycetospora succinea]